MSSFGSNLVADPQTGSPQLTPTSLAALDAHFFEAMPASLYPPRSSQPLDTSDRRLSLALTQDDGTPRAGSAFRSGASAASHSSVRTLAIGGDRAQDFEPWEQKPYQNASHASVYGSSSQQSPREPDLELDHSASHRRRRSSGSFNSYQEPSISPDSDVILNPNFDRTADYAHIAFALMRQFDYQDLLRSFFIKTVDPKLLAEEQLRLNVKLKRYLIVDHVLRDIRKALRSINEGSMLGERRQAKIAQILRVSESVFNPNDMAAEEFGSDPHAVEVLRNCLNSLKRKVGQWLSEAGGNYSSFCARVDEKLKHVSVMTDTLYAGARSEDGLQNLGQLQLQELCRVAQEVSLVHKGCTQNVSGALEFKEDDAQTAAASSVSASTQSTPQVNHVRLGRGVIAREKTVDELPPANELSADDALHLLGLEHTRFTDHFGCSLTQVALSFGNFYAARLFLGLRPDEIDTALRHRNDLGGMVRWSHFANWSKAVDWALEHYHQEKGGWAWSKSNYSALKKQLSRPEGVSPSAVMAVFLSQKGGREAGSMKAFLAEGLGFRKRYIRAYSDEVADYEAKNWCREQLYLRIGLRYEASFDNRTYPADYFPHTRQVVDQLLDYAFQHIGSKAGQCVLDTLFKINTQSLQKRREANGASLHTDANIHALVGRTFYRSASCSLVSGSIPAAMACHLKKKLKGHRTHLLNELRASDVLTPTSVSALGVWREEIAAVLVGYKQHLRRRSCSACTLFKGNYNRVKALLKRSDVALPFGELMAILIERSGGWKAHSMKTLLYKNLFPGARVETACHMPVNAIAEGRRYLANHLGIQPSDGNAYTLFNEIYLRAVRCMRSFGGEKKGVKLLNALHQVDLSDLRRPSAGEGPVAGKNYALLVLKRLQTEFCEQSKYHSVGKVDKPNLASFRVARVFKSAESAPLMITAGRNYGTSPAPVA